jgi:hypothetical protein
MLCFLPRRLLSKKHSVGVARVLVTIKIAVVNRKELKRSVHGHSNIAVL